MRKLIKTYFLGIRKVKHILLSPIWQFSTKLRFYGFGVKFCGFKTFGIPYLYVKNGSVKIGDKFKMYNGFTGNIIGRQQKCIFIANGGFLSIGNNVGISSTTFICHHQIHIGNNVRIGGNTVFYDTDFHSLNVSERIANPENKNNIRTAPILIHDNVFIGAHSTILKGVEIGENSIVGAGSLVSSNIPPNQIWAGNPAKFIREL